MFADIVYRSSWSIGDLLIAVVVIAAVIALVYVALRQFGVSIPGWVVQCFWIVAVCFVVIFCIHLVLSMGSVVRDPLRN